MLTDDEVDALNNSTPEELEAAAREVGRLLNRAMIAEHQRLAWKKFMDKLAAKEQA